MSYFHFILNLGVLKQMSGKTDMVHELRLYAKYVQFIKQPEKICNQVKTDDLLSFR